MADGLALLERAISYTLGSLRLVTSDTLLCPTPCRAWDLRELLRHMYDSLSALSEAADLGEVGPHMTGASPEDLAGAVRERACGLLGAWTAEPRAVTVAVAGHALPAELVAGAGAVEVAVHGWDVGMACGRHRPIPDELANALLVLLPFLVTGEDRPGRFAGPVAVPPRTPPGDRLVAFLGRDPTWGRGVVWS